MPTSTLVKKRGSAAKNPSAQGPQNAALGLFHVLERLRREFDRAQEKADEIVSRRFELSTLVASALFYIAANPGTTQRDLWNAQQTDDSIVSRTVALLTDRGVRNVKGLGLVELRPEGPDYRWKRMYLTPKGERLLADIARDLNSKGA